MLRRHRAFTLMELIVVVIIAGIIASIAIPRYHMAVEKSRAGEGAATLGSFLDAVLLYEFEEGSYPADVDDLDITISNLAYFDNPRLGYIPPSMNNSVLVTLKRSQGTVYYLGINVNGTMYCSSASSGYCRKLGYQE